MPLTLRAPTPADIETCGRIIYAAFHGIAARHGFPSDFASPDQGIHLAQMLIGSPGYFGVVAEQDGMMVGSNFLSESDAIRGVGPITVDPVVQGAGVGRRLMQAVIDRARGAPGVRLVQDGFNTASLSLYASLGFEVKEPLVMMHGRPKSSFAPLPGLTVRPLEAADVEPCAALCRKVHRFDRTSDLRCEGSSHDPWVVTRGGRITAYARTLHFWTIAHGVAESEEDMRALLLGFASMRPQPLWFLLPTRQASFFRWCLSEGLRVIKPLTLMAMGEYMEPAGCWFPSVMY